MSICGLLFSVLAGVLWLLVFGYPLLLRILLPKRDGPLPRPDPLPTVAVLVPVHNEADFIGDKIRNIKQTQYPSHLISYLVVDGGSTDDTLQRAREEIGGEKNFKILELPSTLGKSEKINQVSPYLSEDILVVTDADTRLDPGCILELVKLLERDPRTAVVGATILPMTPLVEERIHWALQNELWWLEGEVFGAASVCGACYAVKTSLLKTIPGDAIAEDVSMSLSMGRDGHAARICRTAVVREIRVPQTVAQFLEFRRRRGSNYAYELKRFAPLLTSRRWRTLLWIRRVEFFLVPWLLVLVTLGLFLLPVFGGWRESVLTAGIFAVPLLTAGYTLRRKLGVEGRLVFFFTFVRFVIIMWLSLCRVRTRRVEQITGGHVRGLAG